MNERGGSGKRRVHLGRSISNSAEQKPRLSARKGGTASFSLRRPTPQASIAQRRGLPGRRKLPSPGKDKQGECPTPWSFRGALHGGPTSVSPRPEPCVGSQERPGAGRGGCGSQGPAPRTDQVLSPEERDTAAGPAPAAPAAPGHRGGGRPGKRRARSEENYRCAGQMAPQLCSRAHA